MIGFIFFDVVLEVVEGVILLISCCIDLVFFIVKGWCLSKKLEI